MVYCEADRSKPYAKGEYNKFDDKEQYIRLSEGCSNCCPFCREGVENPEMKVFNIPEIVRRDVKILDMNLIAHKEALMIIKDLGTRRIDKKVIYYQLLCGVDYRFLNWELALALKKSRFKRIRIAWDFSFTLQRDIREAIRLLLKAGYSTRDITIFMICNWRTTYIENNKKVDLCKVWGVKVADCYFDNQLSPNIKPIYWTELEIKEFRAKVRKHNQLINFLIDPEVKGGFNSNEKSTI